MKTVNLGVYDILKKNEENSLYDILLCKECLCSCLRNNFSRHKKSPKHIEKIILGKIAESIEKTSLQSAICSPTS